MALSFQGLAIFFPQFDFFSSGFPLNSGVQNRGWEQGEENVFPSSGATNILDTLRS